MRRFRVQVFGVVKVYVDKEGVYEVEADNQSEAQELARIEFYRENNNLSDSSVVDFVVNEIREVKEAHSLAYHVVVTDENIDDIMAIALNGGINHWCEKVKIEKRPNEPCRYASEVISNNGILIFTYDDGKTKEVELTKEMFLDGLRLALHELGNTCVFFKDGEVRVNVANIDARGADMIVQYAAFGTLVFG